MKVICLYVNRGKVYKHAADVICSEFQKQGHQAVTEELFDYLDINWMESFSDKFKLFVKVLHMRLDSTAKELDLLLGFAKKHCTRALKSNLQEEPADIIIGTHPYAGRIMAELLSIIRMDQIPVLYYETRLFSISKEALCDRLSFFLAPTDYAITRAESLGQCNCLSVPVISSAVSTLYSNEKQLSESISVLIDCSMEKFNPSSMITLISRTNPELKVIIMSKDYRRYQQKGKSDKRFAYADPQDKEILYSKSDVIIGPADQDDIVMALSLRKPYLIAEKPKKNDYAANYIISHNLGYDFSKGTAEQIAFLRALNQNKLSEFQDNFETANLSFDVSRIVSIVSDALK